MSGLPVDPATQVASVLGWALQAYLAALLLHGLFSWVGADPGHVLVRSVARPTGPVIARVRAFLPVALRAFPLDVAFLVVLCLALCLRYAIVPALESAARLP
ncbi:MAG TPA: YggT family protein [Vicinamibacteria bacterium]|nr:YggT family protein [Vicinamibacteria bacterium]